MAWATTAEVKQAVADAIKRDVADLGAAGPIIDRQVAAAVEKAQGQLRGAFSARGITEAQLLEWGYLHALHYDQSLFYAEDYLRQMFKDALGQMMAVKDHTAELAAVVVTDADGVVVAGTARSGVLQVREAFDARRDWEAYRRGIVAGGWRGPGTAADSTDANW